MSSQGTKMITILDVTLNDVQLLTVSNTSLQFTKFIMYVWQHMTRYCGTSKMKKRYVLCGLNKAIFSFRGKTTIYILFAFEIICIMVFNFRLKHIVYHLWILSTKWLYHYVVNYVQLPITVPRSYNNKSQFCKLTNYCIHSVMGLRLDNADSPVFEHCRQSNYDALVLPEGLKILGLVAHMDFTTGLDNGSMPIWHQVIT